MARAACIRPGPSCGVSVCPDSPCAPAVARCPRATNISWFQLEKSRQQNFSMLRLHKGAGRGRHMRAIAVVMGAVIAVLTFGSAEATVRIRDDMGGLMTEYASRFATMRNRGEKVVIDGP